MIIDDETKVISLYKRHFVVSIIHFAHSPKRTSEQPFTSLVRTICNLHFWHLLTWSTFNGCSTLSCYSVYHKFQVSTEKPKAEQLQGPDIAYTQMDFMVES